MLDKRSNPAFTVGIWTAYPARLSRLPLLICPPYPL